MKTTLSGLSALAVCAGFLLPAQASDDLFQPACFFRPRTTQSNYPPPVTAFYQQAASPCCPQPACNTCPQTSCTTRYQQQSYYQAVTSYQTQTYYEPVTTYQTQSYYEPVTVMRTSYYYCPNSCSYKQTCTPETQYQLRTKSCPIQSYVAKCAQVPVTTYQKAYYYTPQTVCSQSPAPCCPTAAPAPCCQPGAVAGVGINPPQVSAGAAGPSVPPPPIINDSQSPSNSLYPPPPQIKDRMPNSGSSWQPAAPPPPGPIVKSTPAPVQAQSQTVSTTIKLDRIVLGADATVDGDLVRGDKTPRPEARILFVNANQPSLRQTVTTNSAGRFQVTLASGGWLVYLYNLDGEPIFHSRIEVADDQNVGRIVLVNR